MKGTPLGENRGNLYIIVRNMHRGGEHHSSTVNLDTVHADFYCVSSIGKSRF